MSGEAIGVRTVRIWRIVMVLQPMAPLPRQCPRCAGPLYRGYDGDCTCLLCGECIYLDVNPARQETMAVPIARVTRPRGRPRKRPAVA